jgi:hypothetical protein
VNQKISISAGSQFSFIIAGDHLRQRATVLNRIYHIYSEYFLSVNQGKAYLLSFDGQSRCALRLSASDVHGQGIINIDPKLLAESPDRPLSIKVDQDGCHVHAGSGYQRTIQAKAGIEDETIQTLQKAFSYPDQTAVCQLTAPTLAHLVQGMKSAVVRDVYSKKDLPVYLQLSQGKLAVMTYDDYHFGLYESQVKDTGKLEVALYKDRCEALGRLLKLSDNYLKIDQAPCVLIPHNQSFTYITIRMEAQKDFARVFEYLKKLDKPLAQCALPDRLRNWRAQFPDSNIHLTLTTKPSVIRVSYKSPTEAINQEIPAQKLISAQSKVAVQVDPSLWRDLCRSIEKEEDVTLCLYAKALMLKSPRLTLACCLVQKS